VYRITFVVYICEHELTSACAFVHEWVGGGAVITSGTLNIIFA
jgi:hypothetical protein